MNDLVGKISQKICSVLLPFTTESKKAISEELKKLQAEREELELERKELEAEKLKLQTEYKAIQKELKNIEKVLGTVEENNALLISTLKEENEDVQKSNNSTEDEYLEILANKIVLNVLLSKGKYTILCSTCTKVNFTKI